MSSCITHFCLYKKTYDLVFIRIYDVERRDVTPSFAPLYSVYSK